MEAHLRLRDYLAVDRSHKLEFAHAAAASLEPRGRAEPPAGVY